MKTNFPIAVTMTAEISSILVLFEMETRAMVKELMQRIGANTKKYITQSDSKLPLLPDPIRRYGHDQCIGAYHTFSQHFIRFNTAAVKCPIPVGHYSRS